MSAKAGDEDDNEVYVEDEYVEDDDDDEEDDFHPGGGDGDDDDDDDEDDDEEYDDEDDDDDNNVDVSYLDGALSYDKEGQKLLYKGHGFHFESSVPVPLNILDKACKPPLPPDNAISITMEGPCDVIHTEESSGRKPTPRRIQMVFTVADPNSELKFLKSTDDDNEEGAKKPSLYYQVYGNEIDNPKDGIEFKGGFAPISSGAGTDEIQLLCQVRMSNQGTPEAAVAATTTTTTASAAAGKRGRNEDDDNIDDVDDDGIDHNELIALHEDAKLSTEALKKRYRGPSIDCTNGDDNNNDGDDNHFKKKAAHAAGGSTTKHNNNSNADDDDDDDIEF